MDLVFSVFWFFLPAGIANMAPSLFARLPFLETPIDFNKKLDGKPIFGPHKTYRGFLVGIVFAILTVYLQKWLQPHLENYSLVDYGSINILQLGFLLGFGALFGDLIKSFFKRSVDIPSGHSWVPFDQIDWILGAILFSALIVDFKPSEIVAAIILFGLLHPLVNLTGYALKVKNNRF